MEILALIGLFLLITYVIWHEAFSGETGFKTHIKNFSYVFLMTAGFSMIGGVIYVLFFDTQKAETPTVCTDSYIQQYGAEDCSIYTESAAESQQIERDMEGTYPGGLTP